MMTYNQHNQSDVNFSAQFKTRFCMFTGYQTAKFYPLDGILLLLNSLKVAKIYVDKLIINFILSLSCRTSTLICLLPSCYHIHVRLSKSTHDQSHHICFEGHPYPCMFQQWITWFCAKQLWCLWWRRGVKNIVCLVVLYLRRCAIRDWTSDPGFSAAVRSTLLEISGLCLEDGLITPVHVKSYFISSLNNLKDKTLLLKLTGKNIFVIIIVCQTIWIPALTKRIRIAKSSLLSSYSPI